MPGLQPTMRIIQRSCANWASTVMMTVWWRINDR